MCSHRHWRTPINGVDLEEAADRRKVRAGTHLDQRREAGGVLERTLVPAQPTVIGPARTVVRGRLKSAAYELVIDGDSYRNRQKPTLTT